MILDGVYQSGDRLPSEAELAAQFEVGRQSMREAPRILELSGFITIQKGGGGGVRVKDNISGTISRLFLDAFQLEQTSLEELTTTRVEIERVVLKYAVMNADEGDIGALRKNVSMARKKIEKQLAIIDDNITFHQMLAKASKINPLEIGVQAITTSVRHCMSQLRTTRSEADASALANVRNLHFYKLSLGQKKALLKFKYFFMCLVKALTRSIFSNQIIITAVQPVFIGSASANAAPA